MGTLEFRGLGRGRIRKCALSHKAPMLSRCVWGTSLHRIAGWNGLLARGERHKSNAWPRVLLLVPILVLGGILLIGTGHQFSRQYDNADILLVLLYQHTRAGGVSG